LRGQIVTVRDDDGNDGPPTDIGVGRR